MMFQAFGVNLGDVGNSCYCLVVSKFGMLLAVVIIVCDVGHDLVKAVLGVPAVFLEFVLKPQNPHSFVDGFTLLAFGVQ